MDNKKKIVCKKYHNCFHEERDTCSRQAYDCHVFIGREMAISLILENLPLNVYKGVRMLRERYGEDFMENT